MPYKPNGRGKGHLRQSKEVGFWKFVVKGESPEDCWKWTGYINHSYGMVGYTENDRHFQRLANRVSWEMHNGDIPPGLFVLHRCDNPPCCNPAHLFLGTQADNIHDAQEKGRLVSKRSLSESDAHRIHSLRESGLSFRAMARDGYFPVNRQTIINTYRRYYGTQDFVL